MKHIPKQEVIPKQKAMQFSQLPVVASHIFSTYLYLANMVAIPGKHPENEVHDKKKQHVSFKMVLSNSGTFPKKTFHCSIA